MGCQSSAIRYWARPWWANTFRDIENDACEAVLVQEYFLMVRNLSYGTEITLVPSLLGNSKVSCDRGNKPDICKVARQIHNERSAEERSTVVGWHRAHREPGLQLRLGECIRDTRGPGSSARWSELVSKRHFGDKMKVRPSLVYQPYRPGSRSICRQEIKRSI